MNEPIALTDRQLEALTAIVNHVADVGFAPTVRELGAALGLKSTLAVTEMLDRLELAGWIARPRSPKGRASSRGIKVLHAPPAPARAA